MQAAWQYYENRDNGETFSKEEQSSWNEKKKGVGNKDSAKSNNEGS